MKISKGQKIELANPIIITIETIDELRWIYKAFSDGVHARGVDEDSPQQEFYGKAHVAINEELMKYR